MRIQRSNFTLFIEPKIPQIFLQLILSFFDYLKMFQIFPCVILKNLLNNTDWTDYIFTFAKYSAFEPLP